MSGDINPAEVEEAAHEHAEEEHLKRVNEDIAEAEADAEKA